MQKRVVVTGAGLLSPLGNSLEKFWESLKNGRSGIKRLSYFDTSQYSSKVAGMVENFNPEDYFPSKEARRIDKYAQMAFAASKMALENSGIDLERIERERFGVLIGSGIGGIATIEEQHARFLEKGPRKVKIK